MKLINAQTLRELLTARELSYQDLAYSAHVSKGFISHLTAGRKNTCTPEVALRIADCLGVPVGILFMPSLPTSSSQSAERSRRAA